MERRELDATRCLTDSIIYIADQYLENTNDSAVNFPIKSPDLVYACVLSAPSDPRWAEFAQFPEGDYGTTRIFFFAELIMEFPK